MESPRPADRAPHRGVHDRGVHDGGVDDRDFADDVLDTDLSGHTTRELTTRAREVSVWIAAAQAHLVQVVAAIDGAADRADATTPLVALHAGLMPSEARRLTRLARRLPSLPLLDAAFTEGRLSIETAVAIASVATAENEAAVLTTAENATAGQLKELLRTFRKVRPRPDGPDPAHRENTFASWFDEHGRLLLNADLDAELGATVDAALKAARWGLAPDEQRGGGHDEADHVCDACDGDPIERCAAVSAVDGFVRMAESYLASTTTKAGKLPDRYQVQVRVDVGADGMPHAWVPGAGPLSPEQLAMACCDGQLSALLMRDGEPLFGTVPQRLATPAQRRAVLNRDHTCRFPGCGRTSFLHIHHIWEYDAGGPTQLRNLMALCHHHHNQVHHRHLQIDVEGPGRFQFLSFDGTPIDPRREANAPPLARSRLSTTRQHGSRRRPPPPVPVLHIDASRRLRGCGERMTEFGANAILYDWIQASLTPEARAAMAARNAEMVARSQAVNRAA